MQLGIGVPKTGNLGGPAMFFLSLMARFLVRSFKASLASQSALTQTRTSCRRGHVSVCQRTARRVFQMALAGTLRLILKGSLSPRTRQLLCLNHEVRRSKPICAQPSAATR